MKKIVGILLAAVLIAMAASALAQVDLEALRQANLLINLPDACPSSVVHSFYYDVESGECTESFDLYASSDEDAGLRCIFVKATGDIEVWGGGGGCGYVGASGQSYVYGFVGCAYEEIMLDMGAQNMGEFYDGAVVTAEETSESGKLLLTVETPITEDMMPYASFAGATLVTYYTVNPDNLVIEASDVYIRGQDGTEKVYGTSSIEFNVTPELPFDLDALQNAEPGREVHVIMDPGTDAEFDYVLEAPLKLPMVICVPKGYALFIDAACTAPFVDSVQPDADGNYPKSATSYCGPAAQ